MVFKSPFLLSFFLLFYIILILYPSPVACASGYGTHGVVGATLGYNFAEDNLMAFLLGFFSHALLDVMPHHDPGRSDLVGLGFHTAFNLGGLYTTGKMYQRLEGDSRVLWGALGGILPDLEHIFFAGNCWSGNCPRKIYPSHNGKIPHHGDAAPIQGYLNESAVLFFSYEITF